MNDLEELAVRSVLADLVAAAPTAEHEMPPLSTSVHPARSRWPVAIAASVVVVAGVAGSLAVLSREDQSSGDGSFSPDGVELPLISFGPPASSDEPTLAGLGEVVGIHGSAALTVKTTLEYQSNEAPVVVRSISASGYGGMFVPDYAEFGADVFVKLSSNGDVATWSWISLPSGAAYVTYVDGDLELWQRPIGGVVVFPNVGGGDEVAIAYNEQGQELARIDPAIQAAVAERASNFDVLVADIPESRAVELKRLTASELKRCLTDAGTSFVGNVGSVAANAQASQVWDTCVGRTKQTIAARIRELGVTYLSSGTGTQAPPILDPAAIETGTSSSVG